METLIVVVGLIALVVLTLGTGLFVAAEFSLTALERSQIVASVEAVDDRRARRVHRAHSSLSFQLSGAQLGITLTTLLLGYLSEPALAQLLRPVLDALGLPVGAVGAVSLALALLVANTLSMLLGELAPKNLAIAAPMATARATAGPLIVFSTIFTWFISATNNSANWILRRLRVEPAEELRSARLPQELGSLVRSSAQQGTLDAGTATLLDRSLRFGDRTAQELMTPRVRVTALAGDDTVTDLIVAAQRTGHSRFPIHTGDLDEVTGVVHVKQAFTVPAESRDSTVLSSLSSTPLVVPESLDGDTLLDRLRRSGLQLAVVVDEYGGTAGIVTVEDLVEEIIGDVRDEHDRPEIATVRPVGEETWLVSGLLRDDELADAVGFVMPDGDYETVAGLVLARLDRIPQVGDEVVVDGWRLSVARMDGHRIAELRLARDVDTSRTVDA